MKNVPRNLLRLSCFILGLLLFGNLAIAQDEEITIQKEKESTTEEQSPVAQSMQEYLDALKIKQIKTVLEFSIDDDEDIDGWGIGDNTGSDTKGWGIGDNTGSDTKGWGSLPRASKEDIMKARAIDEILMSFGERGGMMKRGDKMGFGEDDKKAMVVGTGGDLEGEEEEEEVADTYENGKGKATETKEDAKGEVYGYARNKATDKGAVAETVDKEVIEDPAEVAETYETDGSGKEENTKEQSDEKGDVLGYASGDDKSPETEQEAFEQEAKEAREKLNQIAAALSGEGEDIAGYAGPKSKCNCTTVSCLISCIKKIIKPKPRKKIKYVHPKK